MASTETTIAATTGIGIAELLIFLMSLPTAPAAIPRGQRVGCRPVSLEITLFTDPACPFAFSAEPARLRLRGTTATSCAGARG